MIKYLFRRRKEQSIRRRRRKKSSRRKKLITCDETTDVVGCLCYPNVTRINLDRRDTYFYSLINNNKKAKTMVYRWWIHCQRDTHTYIVSRKVSIVIYLQTCYIREGGSRYFYAVASSLFECGLNLRHPPLYM